MILLYFIIAITATTIGALTGLGGGIIIKPILDVLGHYDTATIGVLSSVTVFAMAIVSVIKQARAKTAVNYKVVIPLALGAILGGVLGQFMIDGLSASLSRQNTITVIQNVILALLIILVFFYMLYRTKIKSFTFSGKLSSAIIGIFLGICSSFLGIGGGPINVAVFMFFFSYDTKMSAISSIVAILFSQISKLSMIVFTTGFGIYDLTILPFMIIGAILGGIFGSKLAINFTNEQIDKAFLSVQIFVFITCIVNIILNI